MKTNIRLLLLVILMIVAAIALPVHAQQALRVTFVVNGTLGDKSFFDSAERGLERACEPVRQGQHQRPVRRRRTPPVHGLRGSRRDRGQALPRRAEEARRR